MASGGRPRVGVTCSYDEKMQLYTLPRPYADAVARAGGTPLILPYLVEEPPENLAGLAEDLDGLLLIGGPDLDPVHYGEDPHPRLGEVTPERDRFELEVCRLALAAGLPVLAVCRGVQVLAVAAGGSLIQDIPAQVPGCLKHYQDAPRWYGTHRVSVTPGSRLAGLLAVTDLRVNSFHHQAVRQAPPGFQVVATAPDGIVEGLERPGPGFCVGVQWHPEWMWQRDPVFLGLFRGLVQAAGERR